MEKVKAVYESKQELVKSTKHNYKLSSQDKEEIITEYYLNRTKENVLSLCNRYGISESYLYRLIHSKDNKSIEKIIDRNITESRRKFSKRVDKTIEKTLKRINQKLDNGEDINLSQLSTTLGILYDKSRLESNLSTSNTAIEVKVTVER